MKSALGIIVIGAMIAAGGSGAAPPAATSPDMVLVKGETFKMGTTDPNPWASGWLDEKPVHEVTVSDFYIGRTEVTQQQWMAVMGAGNNSSGTMGAQCPVNQVSWFEAVEFCNRLSVREGRKPAYTIRGKIGLPAAPEASGEKKAGKRKDAKEGVVKSAASIGNAMTERMKESDAGEDEWVEAGRGLQPIVFCDWTADGYRLPTEAEWEYAARGGAESKGFRYAGSNQPEEVAWYQKTVRSFQYWLDRVNDQSGQLTINAAKAAPMVRKSKGKGAPEPRSQSEADQEAAKIHPVGLKMPNELGLYDMSGNVWEWCWDWYNWGYYEKSPQLNPRGPDNGAGRVIRGGGCATDDSRLRLTYRSLLLPSQRAGRSTDFIGAVGLRVVRNK